MKICIIPARGGSRRIPRKNIRDFNGEPIISYSIRNAQKVGFDRIVVSTEDPEIANIAMVYGTDVEIFQRSFAMARDDVGTQAVARDCLEGLKLRGGRCCVLYATVPLLTPQLIAAGEHHRGYAVGVGVEPLRDAGAFYWGTIGDFRAGEPLYNEETRLIVIPEPRICDINEEEDWARAEQMYERLKG